MKVHDLIKKLQGHPQYAEVYIVDTSGDVMAITEIEYERGDSSVGLVDSVLLCPAMDAP